MKKVERFEAEDGSLFDSVKDAIKRDRVVKAVKEVRAILGPNPKDTGCNFSNGGGYYQLTQTQVETFDNKLVELVKEYEPWIFDTYFEGKTADQILKSHALGRSLCDSDSPLYSLVIVKTCIDSSCRLWGQSYFASNPNEGKQVKLG